MVTSLYLIADGSKSSFLWFRYSKTSCCQCLFISSNIISSKGPRRIHFYPGDVVLE